eukprot:3470655-Ditylum_brightwellii.AAC.1
MQGDDSVIAWNLLDLLLFHAPGEISAQANQLIEVVENQVGRYFNQLHLACSIECCARNPLVADVAVLSDIHLELRQ